MAINRVALLFFWIPISSFSQDRYFVSFKDKANTPYSVSNPLQFLSQKSIDRRVRENFPVIEEDFPVDTAYVHKVKKTGASVFFTSRWFNGVLIQTDATIASTVSALPFVSKVELVAPKAKLIGGRRNASNKFEQTNSNAADLLDQFQLQMIGLDKMHEAGYHGEGVDIAVLDAGFIGVDTITGFKPLYNEGRLKSVFNFVTNTANVYTDHYHGTNTLSILAGNIPGKFLGGAYQANFFLYQTEDVRSEYRIEEYNWAFAAERADSAGVDVISSSLGYFQFDDPNMDYTYQNLDGKTTVITQAARKAVERGILVINSAGNEGGDVWKYIIAPADAKGVIATGAVDASENKTDFSSVGPSADGRIKPDVSALGNNDVLISTPGCCYQGSGTSFSCPLVASLVAGLRQALPQASAKEIYQRVINSASQATRPDNLLGYGIPNFTLAKDLVDFQDEFLLYPNPVKDVLRIIFKDPGDQVFNAIIFNSAGQKVVELSDSISWSNNPYSLDVSSLATGLYLVKVQTSTSNKTDRIVKIN